MLPHRSTNASATGLPGRGVRLFVVAFLAVFLGTSLAGVEAWPATGWRLFSHTRSGEEWRYEVIAVTADGSDHPLDLDAFGIAGRGGPYLLGRWPQLGQRRRRAVCEGLLELARRRDPAAGGIRVRLVARAVATRRGRPDPPPERAAAGPDCGVAP